MNFEYSDKVTDLIQRVRGFIDEYILPNESTHTAQVAENPWETPPVVEELKPMARDAGLWNLFLPLEHGKYSAGLTNMEYAPLAEEMGRVLWASEVFNCAAPDTGNMEVLAKYGDEAQKQQWLKPLLAGEIRSAFAMTEPAVASSDARNICSTIFRDGDEYVLNGHKWWSSGSGDPRCKLYIFMGKTDPDNNNTHRQQSMILVAADTPGIDIVRNPTVLNHTSPEGHCEIVFRNVRVPVDNLLGEEGAGVADPRQTFERRLILVQQRQVGAPQPDGGHDVEQPLEDGDHALEVLPLGMAGLDAGLRSGGVVDWRDDLNEAIFYADRGTARELRPAEVRELLFGREVEEVIDEVFFNNADRFLSRYFSPQYLSGSVEPTGKTAKEMPVA